MKKRSVHKKWIALAWQAAGQVEWKPFQYVSFLAG